MLRPVSNKDQVMMFTSQSFIEIILGHAGNCCHAVDIFDCSSIIENEVLRCNSDHITEALMFLVDYPRPSLRDGLPDHP